MVKAGISKINMPKTEKENNQQKNIFSKSHNKNIEVSEPTQKHKELITQKRRTSE